MLLGEGHCVVIDATNQAVKADAAQGLATFDEYAAEVEKIYVEGKFKQLLSTIDLAKKHGGWDGEVVERHRQWDGSARTSGFACRSE
jgi:hypothetical protein